MTPAERILAVVAAELDWLDPPPVFIGGATIGLFLDAFGRAQLRPTKDVDCIVASVLTRGAWNELEAELRRRNWRPDLEGPVCRYYSPAGHVVDLLGARPEVQGFAGAWFEAAAMHTRRHTLAGSVSITTPTAPYLFACKIEAFRDRGAHDPFASTDLEDLVALLDGCVGLDDEILACGDELQDFIATWARQIRVDRRLTEAAEGHLPRGGDVVGRRTRLERRLDRLALR